MKEDLLYQLALGDVPHIGAAHARTLLSYFETAKEIFQAKRSTLEKIPNIGSIRAQNLKRFTAFSRAEAELAFIDKHNIKPLFFREPAYPGRLLHCADPPPLLFYKGVADLNTPRIVAVVGTRKNTEYGSAATERLIRELCDYNVLVVSGLAYGIDAIAHQASLRSGLQTVGVVAHGLDIMYPSQHRTLARQMSEQGGILTEFKSGTRPDKYNFPSRNRIVAGMSDATVVIETHTKGGSLITADIANGYNREVFAVPGRVTDIKSSGCNELICSNKAILFQSGAQLAQVMGWNTAPRTSTSQQTADTLNEDQRRIVELLRTGDSMSIDQIVMRSGLGPVAIMSLMLELELRNLVKALPGNRYRLAG